MAKMNMTPSTIEKGIQLTDRIKMDEYISSIENYREQRHGTCFGKALISLRQLWELVFAYRHVDQDGVPYIKKSGDKDSVVKIISASTPPLPDAFNEINHYAHYNEEHLQLTDEGFAGKFCELVYKSKPILEAYCSNYLAPNDPLFIQLTDMFRAFEHKYTEYINETNLESANRDFDAYLEYLCSIICRSEDDPLVNAYYSRYITEMLMTKRLQRRGSLPKRTNFEDLANALNQGVSSSENSDTENQNKQDKAIATCARGLQDDANDLFHWYHVQSSNDPSEVNREIATHNQVIREKSKHCRNNLARNLRNYLTAESCDNKQWTAVSTLVAELNSTEKNRDILRIYTRLEEEAEQKKIAQHDAEIARHEAKTARRIAKGIIIGFLLIALLIAGHIYHTDSHWNDPNPQLSEALSADVVTEALPTIELFVANKRLDENEVTVLYADSQPFDFALEAQCLTEDSMHYSQDERFARLKGFAQNPYGLSLLAYRIQANSFGSDDQTIEVTQQLLSVGNRTADFSQTLVPGWYTIQVQAVGAADGMIRAGKELDAATGWHSYEILVLPENGTAEWSLLNRNTNQLSNAQEGLPVQEGHVLEVECRAEVTMGLTFQYRWDTGDWQTIEPNEGIRVPRMDADLHTLHLRAGYVHSGEITVEEAYSESFGCMYKAPVIPECNVQLTLKGPGGDLLADGARVVVEPGDKLELTVSSQYGIQKILRYVTDETGKQLESKRATLEGATQWTGSYPIPENSGTAEQTWRFRVIGNGYDGEGDTLNSKEISIQVLYRVPGDLQPGEDEKIEWLYENPSSNEPTGYILYADYDSVAKRYGSGTYYTADGQPTYSNEYGYHRMVRIYEMDGDTLMSKECWVYDINGELMEGTDAFGESSNGAAGDKWVYEYPETGKSYWHYYYGADGQPHLDERGIASYRLITDEHGNVTDDYTYGLNGEPVENSDGWHRYQSVYEQIGSEYREVESLFYDANGDPCDIVYGYQRRVREYDEAGHVVSEISYTADGKPVIQDGYAKWAKVYKEGTEHVISTEYQDENGRLVMNTALGYASVTMEYEGDQIIFGEYRDAGNALVCSAQGYASYSRTWNGLTETVAYRDQNGELVIPKNKTWVKQEIDYDAAKEKVKERRYYKNETELVAHDDEFGIARVVYEYTNGRLTGEFYYNAENEPQQQLGDIYCGMSYIHDENNESVYHMYYLDENGERIVNDWGFYRAKKTEDSADRVIREERFLQDGTHPSGDAVWLLEWSYYEDGTLKSYIEYTELLEGTVSKKVLEYDTNGMLTSLAFYDGNNQAVADEHGVWKYTFERTETEEEREGARKTKVFTLWDKCLDVSGSLTEGPNGYAAARCLYSEEERPDYISVNEYDSIGQYDYSKAASVEIRFFGPNGKMAMNRNVGYAAYRRESSDTRNVVEYFDNNGNYLIPDGQTWARRVYEYDLDGNVLEETYYLNGTQLVALNEEGVARYSYRYENGRQIEVFHRDAQDKPLAMPGDTYCGKFYEYDPEDPSSYLVYFLDADKNRIVNDYGFYCARITQENGEVVREERFMQDGSHPADGTVCCLEWNEDGSIKTQYYKYGDVICGYSYDADGRIIRITYWSDQWEPITWSGTNYYGTYHEYDLENSSDYTIYYLDIDGNRIINECGFYCARIIRENGEVVCEERFLQDGSQPMGDQIYRIEWHYDEDGRETGKTEYSENGETVWLLDPDGNYQKAE